MLTHHTKIPLCVLSHMFFHTPLSSGLIPKFQFVFFQAPGQTFYDCPWVLIYSNLKPLFLLYSLRPWCPTLPFEIISPFLRPILHEAAVQLPFLFGLQSYTKLSHLKTKLRLFVPDLKEALLWPQVWAEEGVLEHHWEWHGRLDYQFACAPQSKMTKVHHPRFTKYHSIS